MPNFFEESAENEPVVIGLLKRTDLDVGRRYEPIEEALQHDSQQANKGDDDGDTPLIYLTDEDLSLTNHIDPNEKAPLVNLLLQYGADPLYTNRSYPDYQFLGNSSPLVIAAMQGHTAILQKYLNHFSQTYPASNWYDIHDDFAELLVASTEGVHTAVIETLLEDYNFDPNRPNRLGQLPLPYLLAKETFRPPQDRNTIELEDDTQYAVATLIKNGADPSLREPDSNKNAYEVVSNLPRVRAYLNEKIEEYQSRATLTPT